MTKRRKAALQKKRKVVASTRKNTTSAFEDLAVQRGGPHQPNFTGLLVITLLLDIVEQLRIHKGTMSGQRPPELGEFALYLILSKEDREYLIGDLREEFIEVRARFGSKKASVWYYKQVLTSAWPLIRKAIRLGVIAWIGEWIRRRV